MQIYSNVGTSTVTVRPINDQDDIEVMTPMDISNTKVSDAMPALKVLRSLLEIWKYPRTENSTTPLCKAECFAITRLPAIIWCVCRL